MANSLNSSWLDVTDSVLRIKGLRFFAVRKAGRSTSASIEEVVALLDTAAFKAA